MNQVDRKLIDKDTKLFRNALKEKGIKDAGRISEQFRKRLTDMFSSELYAEHDVYPTINTPHVYAVIAMCLELKGIGLADSEIIDTVNTAFKVRRGFFHTLIYTVDLLPNAFRIARKWNINDHDKRVRDGSITYDLFDVKDDRVEYSISKCRYVDMFEAWGIRGLCRIFCMTDEASYALLTRHVTFIRHSDLSHGDCCHDEVIRKA